MGSESLRHQVLYELRLFGVNALRAAETLGKCRAILDGLAHRSRPCTTSRLSFPDFDVLQRIERAMARPTTRGVLEEAQRQTGLPNLARIAATVLQVHCVFRDQICPRIYSEFQSGDAIFYDLYNRQRVGLEMSPNMLLSLQKAYDRFSHSGLFLEAEDGSPALFHGLRIKLKRLTWIDAVYMPRRILDFSKIFAGFADLKEDNQRRVREAYQLVARRLGQVQDDYEFDPPSMMSGLSMFFTSRKYTRTPAKVSRRGGSAQNTQPHSTPAPTSPTPPLADTGSEDDTASLAGRQTSDPAIEAFRQEAQFAESVVSSCPPGAGEIPEASTMLCSGFTASVLMECMRKVQHQLPDLQRELRFTKSFSVDVHHMTPGDLHSWPIWQTWTDDNARAQQARFYVFADEVFSHWWGADRALC